MNYGLMAFNQTGYYPYLTGTSTTITQTRFFTWGELQGKGYLNADGSPQTSFTLNGVVYTLSSNGGGNSQYQRWGFKTSHDYCGMSCAFSGITWQYKGSYYTWTQTSVNSSNATLYTVAPIASPAVSPFPGQTVLNAKNNVCTYFPFPWNYANGSGSPGSSQHPVYGMWSSSNSCDDSNNVDAELREPIELSDSTTARNISVQRIRQWLQPQTQGGLVAEGGTPTGCALQYTSSGSNSLSTTDAYSYFVSLAGVDTLAACRKSYVILVTDGEPNGPGDDATCGSSYCASTSLSGCSCRSVLAAKNLLAKGIKTYAVGFGPEAAGAAFMDNIARAGGTCRTSGCAYAATNEAQLTTALTSAVFDALQGDYATAPPTVATSTQTGGSGYLGNIGLLSSTDFPSWNGHLRAVDLVNLTSGAPTPLWDAGQSLAARAWSTRKVYTSNPANNVLVPFVSSGVANGAGLYALGLGASATEAESIIRFSLGENRAWNLGSMLNSTPVTMGASIDSTFPGHSSFVQANGGKPRMLYVGADDAMLHAFYLETGTWGNAGDEAWAYVPPELLPTLTKLYVNGGQPSDPFSHINGIGSSPKVNDVCQSPCSSASDWRTALVSGEGAGGSNYFALDITAQPSAATPITVLWNTSGMTNWPARGGESWSVPAFGASGSGSTLQSIVSFGSGYDDVGDANFQGTWFTALNPVSGVVLLQSQLVSPAATIVEYSVLADTASAVDSTGKTIASYQVDLGGRLWRFAAGTSAPSAPLFDEGVLHPYYYSPAAMARDDGTVVLAFNDSTFYEDDPDISGTDPTKIPPTPNLSIGLDLTPLGMAPQRIDSAITSICSDKCTHGSCAGCPKFSASARPIGSPLILRNSASTASSPVQAIYSIYQPGSNACATGQSAVVVLDIVLSGSTGLVVKQSEARPIAGSGIAAGVSLSAGGVLVSANSGRGAAAQSSISTVSGTPTASSTTTSGPPDARVMGITETSY